MAWNDFVASTTIRASEFNENFAWIQGDIVPMSNGVQVNNAFSLGTDTAKWLNLKADKINVYRKESIRRCLLM